MPVLARGLRPNGLRRESAFIAFFVSINLGGSGRTWGAMFELHSSYQRTFQGLFLFVSLCTALAALLSLVALKPPAGQPSLMSAQSPQPGPPLQKVARWPVAVLGLTWMLGHCADAQLNMTIRSWRDHADLTLGAYPVGAGLSALDRRRAVDPARPGPLVVLGFLALRKRGIEPSATAKIGIGLVLQLLPCALLLRGVVNMPEGLPLGLAARCALAGALPSLLLLPLVLSVLAQLVPATTWSAVWTNGLCSLRSCPGGGHLAAWTRAATAAASFMTPAVFALLAAGAMDRAVRSGLSRLFFQDTGQRRGSPLEQKLQGAGTGRIRRLSPWAARRRARRLGGRGRRPVAMLRGALPRRGIPWRLGCLAGLATASAPIPLCLCKSPQPPQTKSVAV